MKVNVFIVHPSPFCLSHADSPVDLKYVLFGFVCVCANALYTDGIKLISYSLSSFFSILMRFC